MKNKLAGALFLLLTAGGSIASFAQQLPIFTQFPSDELIFNPAVAGTKRIYDIRLNYRKQWAGFPDAPVTQGISLNYRLLGGKMGVAGYVYEDYTGPTQRNDYTLCYAYHLKLPDLVVSLGVAGSMTDYFVKGNLVTIHQLNDPAIDQTVTSHAWTPDASAGFYLYNDRWKMGLSVSNLIQQKENLYKTYSFPADTSKSGIVALMPHYYGYLSYNFSGNPNYIWQSSLFVTQTTGTPIYVAYSMRVHIKEKLYLGMSFRLKDAIALDAGYIFKDNFQICYSYDYITSAIGHFTTGSHEITLIWSADSFSKKGHRGDSFDGFQRRKFGYMF